MLLRQLFLISSSRVHGCGYLEFAENEIKELLNRNNVKSLLFIPYALWDHESYVSQIREVFEKWGYKVQGINECRNPKQAIENAGAIYVGGGNTFLLLKALYENDVVESIRRRVLNDGVPYIGSSAGTNVATRSINTTNDMPIVYPPTFQALNLVPFNINPHYQDPDPKSTHQGETRELRILQYHEIPGAAPVLGLREGSFLEVNGNKMELKGPHSARLFVPRAEPKELDAGTDLSFLLDAGSNLYKNVFL